MSLSEEDKVFIKKILPEKYPYTPIKFTKEPAEKHDFGYQLEISILEIVSVEELNEFIREFGRKNEACYTLTNSSKKDAFYRGWYRCQHYHKVFTNPTSRRKARKGTECESKISAVMSVFKKDPSKKTTKIKINFIHNHSLTSEEALRYRIPSSDVQQIFKNLFESHRMGPADALRAYRKHLEQQALLKNEPQLNQIANRGIMPDYDWVRHFHGKMNSEKCAMQRDVVENLKEFISELDEPNTIVSFKQLSIDDQNFVTVVITPLMKRVSETKSAGEMIFIDGTGSVDKFGLRVFLILTKVMGSDSMPVGIVITTSETTDFLQQSFEFFASLTNEKSFGGRGRTGPAVILTNDSAGEARALRAAFPNATMLLCSFHFLLACNRWIQKSVKLSCDQKSIYAAIRDMLYAKNEERFQQLYDHYLKKFSKKGEEVGNYFRHIFAKRQKWAMCFRRNKHISCGSETNNIVERSVRLLKEDILERMKTQSPAELVDFILKDFDSYYRNRILDPGFEKNHLHLRLKQRQLSQETCNNYSIEKGCESFIFKVFNNKKKALYEINTDVGICTCYVGCTGIICKHQLMLELKYQNSPQPPIDLSELYYIATGSKKIPKNYFQLLRDYSDSNSSNVSTNNQLPNSTSPFPANAVIQENLLTENIQSIEISHEEIDLFPAVDEKEVEEEIEKFQRIIELCVEKIRTNPGYYLEGLKSMNKDLTAVLNSCPANFLKMLHSLNKSTG